MSEGGTYVSGGRSTLVLIIIEPAGVRKLVLIKYREIKE
jgi:hypothetical protein